MKRTAILLSVVLAAFCLACGLQAQERKDFNSWERIASWEGKKPKSTVLSGCELKIDGIQCRLFGIRISKDSNIAALAKRWLELYMQTCGDYFAIYNVSNPISSKDGIPLVWLVSYGNEG